MYYVSFTFPLNAIFFTVKAETGTDTIFTSGVLSPLVDKRLSFAEIFFHQDIAKLKID